MKSSTKGILVLTRGSSFYILLIAFILFYAGFCIIGSQGQRGARITINIDQESWERIMEPTKPKAKALTAREVLIRTLLSEAGGGQPIEGLVGVGHVIQNRARATGKHPTQVVLRDKQFSFWNDFNAKGRDWENPPKLSSRLGATNEQVNLAGDLADRILAGEDIPGPPMDSTMFYNPAKVSPSWVKSMANLKRIGDHVFGVIPGEYGVPK